MRPNNPASQQEEDGTEGWLAFNSHIQHFQSSAQLSGSASKPIKPHSPTALAFENNAATASHLLK